MTLRNESGGASRRKGWEAGRVKGLLLGWANSVSYSGKAELSEWLPQAQQKPRMAVNEKIFIIGSGNLVVLEK